VSALHFVLPGDPATRTGGYAYDRRIAAGLRALGCDVHGHALDASFPFPDAAALRHAGAVLQALDDDACVLVDGLALGAMPDVAAAHGGRLRIVALVHHPLAAETGLDSARAAALAASERRALAATRGVVVTSAATAADVAAYGVPPARIRIVEPGTDPAPQARGARGGTAAPVALLCVATLVPRKGHALLLDALAALRALPWQLTCVGAPRDPATAAALCEQLERLGLADRVTFAGELDAAALETRWDAADAFVLAAHHEGYGMACAEALAHGLPLVATRAGAVAQFAPANAALLVPPGDGLALREALRRFLTDAALRTRLAAGARRARTALPTWNAAARRMASALRELAGVVLDDAAGVMRRERA